jgi:hypothetical protein
LKKNKNDIIWVLVGRKFQPLSSSGSVIQELPVAGRAAHISDGTRL